MEKYIEIVINAYQGYASYLWNEIIHPHEKNYFYWLLIISGFFFFLEVTKPWRTNQALIRKDFWLDFFYMFFNFFLFSLIIYNAASDLVVNLFNDGIQSLTNINLKTINPLYAWPLWAVLLVGFVVRDFVQWNIHRLLHRVPRLWEFHKVHHSVEEMGFAAHLRYHWMENIVYRFIEYIPLALLGIGLYDFFIIHIFTLTIGHFNHSNISVDGKVTGGILGGLIGIVISISAFDINILTNVSPIFIMFGSVIIGIVLFGPIMKYIFNSPEMHIWHHSYELPDSHKYGINFGLSLAIWDYIFGTAHIPHDGRDIRLGFPNVENFPKNFIDQNKHGF